jgi:hypothetical protein
MSKFELANIILIIFKIRVCGRKVRKHNKASRKNLSAVNRFYGKTCILKT